MAALHTQTVDAFKSHQNAIVEQWLAGLEASGATRNIKEGELRQQSAELLNQLVVALETSQTHNIAGSQWADVRQVLEKLSHSRALLGHDSHQTAHFIFALKGPLFAVLQKAYESRPGELAEQLLVVSDLLDGLGMHTIRTFQKSREMVIKRQQEELLELSTPVVKLWEGVLALPMIGTLDSQRT